MEQGTMTDVAPSLADGADDIVASQRIATVQCPRARSGERGGRSDARRAFPRGNDHPASGRFSLPALVIRSGHVEIRESGRVLDQPGAGEVFGELSL